MSFFSSLFSDMGAKVTSSIFSGLDSLFTSDSEREQLKNVRAQIENETKRIINEAAKQADQHQENLEKELTERLSLDMKSDNWLSKNVRPLLTLGLFVIFCVLSITDGNMHWNDMRFTVGPEYIEGFKTFFYMAMSFYFGSRGLEKIQKHKADVELQKVQIQANAHVEKAKIEAQKKADKEQKDAEIWGEDDNISG